jgi:hypothetical protein
MCVGNGGVAEHVAYFDARIAKSFSGSASVHRHPDWHRFFRRPRHGAAGALFRLRPHSDGDDRSCLRAIYIEDGRLARKERVDYNAYQLRSVS